MAVFTSKMHDTGADLYRDVVVAPGTIIFLKITCGFLGDGGFTTI